MVTASGDLVTIGRGDLDFDGMVVALGALGIVTRVTLDIQPAYEMRQDAFEGLPWSTLLADFDAVMSAGYSVSLLTSWSRPTVTRMWVKTQLADGTPEVPRPRIWRLSPPTPVGHRHAGIDRGG